MNAKILIVEDDIEMRRVLELELAQHNYEVFVTADGLEGLRLFYETKPDLVVLDIALPGMDGLTICQRIREVSSVPILIMTAHAITEEEIAAGLDMGADEYMLKPLRNLEFQARVNALLRRVQLKSREKQESPHYADGYLQVDVGARTVIVNNQDVRLTPTEFKLLSIFIGNQGQVLTFQQLLEQVWGPEYSTEYHYPRIYVSHLRQKIEPDVQHPAYIHNEYGIGYRFVGQE